MSGKVDVFISSEKIEERLAQLGQQITSDYGNKKLVVICILKGAFIFCSDLIRYIKTPLKMEFIKVSSYGDDTKSSGHVKFELDVSESLNDKDVLIVEDIVDSGLTMKELINHVRSHKPSSVKVASLLLKPENLTHEVKVDYVGFSIPNKFVIGYGLDYAGHYRELPYIGVWNADS